MPILNPTYNPFPAGYPGPFFSGPFPSPWPPGTKPVQQSPINNLNLTFLLRQYLLTGTTIAEVFIRPTQIPGEPDITNVRVVAIGNDSVTFAPAGSFGGGLIIVRFEDIVAIELV